MLDLKPNQDNDLLPVFLDILRQRDEHRDLLWRAWYLMRHVPDPEGCNQSWLADAARLLGVRWPTAE